MQEIPRSINHGTASADTTEESLRQELEQCHQRIGELARAEALLAGENRILESVARGEALSEILTDLCRCLEELCGGSLCGILLVNAKENRVEHGAAPSLPSAYNEAIHGRAVNPSAGPCGLAICQKEQVIAADIASDERWADDWRALALAHGLRACWSTPIAGCGGNLLGTFAIYWREPRRPNDSDQQLIEQSTHLAAVAIERRRIEEQLLRSERNLAEGQRLTKTGSWVLDFKTGNTDWSVETCRIFGFPDPPPSPHYQEFRARVRPEDRDGVDRGLRESFETGEPRPLKYVFILPDGTRKNIETISQPFRDEAGELKLMGTVMDVTEREQAQAAVQAAKARFEGILEIADDAIISVDSRQHIVLFNRGAEKMFGYLQAEVLGQSLDLLLPQRFAEAHREHIRAFAESSEVARTMAQRREVFGRRKDRSEFPAEASISKLSLGSELVFTVILRDITERKRAAEALRASEHLARGQLEALSSSLDSLSRESEPEKFLEHVLRIAGGQLEAVGVSVWEMNGPAGCVQLAANYRGGVLYAPAGNEAQPTWRMVGAGEDHPVWTRFFRTGRHCVYGRIQNGPPWSEVAIDPNGPWYDWRGGMVDHPLVPQMIKDIAASGVVATLNVPMLVADQVAGLFVLCFQQQRAFRPDEIELTRAMASQAMLAIKLMRLSQANRESAVLAERNRMARDLHDTLAQGFTGVITQLEATKGAMVNADAPSALAHIERAENLARASLGEARRSVRAMRSRSLLDGTLSTALSELLQRMTNGTELQPELVVTGDGRPMPPDWEEGLLRIAQESLTNTIKYAEARSFRATLSFLTNAVRLQLVDDGRGFTPQTEHDGFGLVGMRERAEQLAGQFTLRSSPGQGTEIVVELKQPGGADGNDENQQA